MDNLPEEDRFHRNVIDLTQLIHELVEDAHNRGYQIINPNLIILGSMFLQGYNKQSLINNFITYSHADYWEEIRHRDENFFSEHASKIFQGLPVNNVNAFKELFVLKDANGQPVISQEDRDVIWEYFDSLIIISIKYVHRCRGPQSKVTGDGVIQSYTKRFMEYVDLPTHVRRWSVHLEYPSA